LTGILASRPCFNTRGQYMRRLIKNPLGLAAVVLILVAVLMPAAAYLGYRSNLSNLDEMLYSKGSALMESVLHGAENAVLADGEIIDELTAHLADNARYLLLLDEKGLLDETAIATLAQAEGLVRLDLYSPSGTLKASSNPARAPLEFPRELANGYQGEGVFSAFISGEAPSGPEEQGSGQELFAVGLQAADSSVGVAYVDAAELIELRRRLGIGLILDDLSAIEGVTYALLQDTLGIIAASSQVVSMGSIKEDPFFPIPGGKIKGRYRDYSGQEVYELAAGFQLGGENYGYLRVGLSTEEIRSIAEGDRKRFIMGMVVLMVLFAVVAALYFAARSQLILEQEHSRIKSLSESVLQGMTESVIVLDEENRIILYNNACKKICGCEEREVLGFGIQSLNPALAEKLAALERDKIAALETEIAPAGSPDKIPVMLSAAPLEIAGKRYSTIIITDLTDRKEAEKLALRNQKFKTMAEISAGVAHEIRNPLNAIGMNVQRLKLEFTPSDRDKDEYGEFIDSVLAEVKRINNIVEQFLTLARFPGPNLAPGKIVSLLEDTVTFLQPELAARGIKLEKSLAQAPPFLFDPDQIRQVLTNLIKNAAESMGDGGGLKISGRPEDSDYLLTVSDTGPGIAEENRERIFEPFFSTKKNGLGLGLAIVQRIVTEHGGTIRIFSEKGQGTTFVVSLPMKSA